jgi:hypothetical protein
MVPTIPGSTSGGRVNPPSQDIKRKEIEMKESIFIFSMRRKVAFEFVKINFAYFSIGIHSNDPYIFRYPSLEILTFLVNIRTRVAATRDFDTSGFRPNSSIPARPGTPDHL